jgi:hypothetical protein
MTDADDLDLLLSRLRAAEAAGESSEVLSDIRRRITAAANAEARAREAKRDADELAARGPGFARGDGLPEPPVLFLPDDRRDLPIGRSRFGGLPDLPAAMQWPTHQGRKLPFLAQLDLASLPLKTRLLPSEGWLVAFGLFEDQLYPSYPLLVRLVACDRSDLVRAPRPHQDEIWPANPYESLYDLVPLKVRTESGAKPLADYGEKNCCGWLFGEVDDFWGTAGSLAFDARHSGDDWINLLAIDSVGSMQWSDCGHLYLLARRRDLSAGDLSKVVAVICST